MKRIMVATLAVFVAFAFAATAGAQEAKPDGKALFLDKKCNTCHTLKALGIQKRVASAAGEKKEAAEASTGKAKTSDLSSVGLDVKADWMTKFLKRLEMTKKGKKHLLFKGTDEELAVITTWLEEQKAPKTAPEAAPKKAGAK